MPKTFQTEYVNKGAHPETKRMIIKLAVNGSGVRDTARVLGISKDTVAKVLKKRKNHLQVLTLNCEFRRAINCWARNG